MTTNRHRYDAVIVGSGAGGGPLALELSRAGLDVLVLEKGPRFEREHYRHDTGLQPGQFIPSIEREPHTVVTRTTTEPLRTQLGWIATCVGGGTVHMGGYLYRFHPADFEMASQFGAFGAGDGLELADWPYGYEELEPYYGQAEWAVGVAGAAGSSPFEGVRSRAYPMVPLDSHPLADRLDKACRQLGLHPFPTPRAVNSRPYDGRPACEYCPMCSSWGCPVGARGTSQETLIARAEATGHCCVLPLAMACRVEMDARGRAAGVVYLDTSGREHRAAARLVCVCASAIESARLLLMSTSSRFPAGLGNDARLVGRHLQFHAVTMGHGRLGGDVPNGASHSSFLGRSIMDHYLLPDGLCDLAKGGLLRFDLMPPTGTTSSEVGRSIYYEAFHDFLPNSGTFVELDDLVTDHWGLPVARIHLDLPSHHRQAGEFLAQRAAEILAATGAVDIRHSDIGGTSSYLVHGTCRAGNRPETSVIDGFGKLHEVPNVYVVDGSFMPTSGGAPPTLTILAQSFRTAEHLRARFAAGELS